MKIFQLVLVLLIGLTLGMAGFDWHVGEKTNAFWMLGLSIINMQTLAMHTR